MLICSRFVRVFIGFLALYFFVCQLSFANDLLPPEVAAKSFILIDVSADQTLAERDADQLVEPASLTKLMTAYLVFDAINAKKIHLQQNLSVSERAWRMPGSRMFIDPKMQVPVEDLIKGMIVQSGNDATVVLAEAVGGSVERFVESMNDQAKRLGMLSTVYKNPEGLTAAGHVTTARDLGLLARAIYRDFPQYVHYYALKKYRYANTPVANDTNRNLLLFRDPSVDGLKTGHTSAAGYCLIASSRRDFPNLQGRRLLSVVLGAASEVARANESQKLLNWGFTAYEGVKLFDAGQSVVTAKVWKGQSAAVGVGRNESVIVAVPVGAASALRTQVVRLDPVVAPVSKDRVLGSLQVLLGDKKILEKPLYALDSVPEAGVLGRAWDALRMWVQ